MIRTILIAVAVFATAAAGSNAGDFYENGEVPAAFYDLSGRRLASVQSRYSSVGRVMLRASVRGGCAGVAVEAPASPSRVSSAGDGGGQP